MDRNRIARTLGALGLVAALAVAQKPVQAQTPVKWRLVGQLELPQGERVGPLTVSPFGELVAGTAWDGETRFTGRIWSLNDGLQVSALEESFQALLEIDFGQSLWDPITMAAPVYAHGRREFRTWSIADGALTRTVTFDGDVLANDVLYDPFRAGFIVSQDFGSLLVFSDAGEPISSIEVDPMRPHRGLQLSNDGALLVVNSASFTLTAPMSGLPYRCADVLCAEAYHDVPGSYGPYEALLAFDPQGLRVATLPEVDPERAGLQNGPFRAVSEPTIRVWTDVRAWVSEARPEVELSGFRSPPVWGQFAADGMQLLTLEDAGHLAIWDMTQGARVFQLDAADGDGVVAARFIPNSTTLFVSWASGVSRIVDTERGATIQTLPQPSADAVVSPDGRTLITYSVGEAPARIWRRR